MNLAASPLPTENTRPSWDRWCRYGVIACLVAQFLLACDTARRLTPTHDEYWHLPIGLLIWKTGRFDCDVINPPLLRLWASLPLVLGGAKLDTAVRYTQPGEIGDLFWMSNPEHRMLWFTLGRIMITVINGATGWLLACWGRRWFGDRVALAVAILWCSCPNILAHGSLVTHDAAAAFGFVSTLFAVVCWCEQPGWKRAAIAGFCLGIAPLLKVTCILLFPLAIITWFLIPPLPNPPNAAEKPRPNWRNRLGQWAIVFGLSLFVMNLGYLFEQTGESLRSMTFASQRFQQLQKLSVISSLPMPLPRVYFQALDRVAQDLQNAHQVYLDGDWDSRGFRTYYLKTLVYKLPLGTWFMLAMATIGLWSRRQFELFSNVPNWSTHRRPQIPSSPLTSSPPPNSSNRSIHLRRQAVLLIPVLMLIVPASMGSNQFGIRYILPILPFLYLFAAEAAIPLSNPKWRWKQWLIVAALVSLPFSLRFHPDHLAYFNEAVGGPDQGRYLLVDSNLDWGQDLNGLAKYLREKKIDKIGLAYFGTVHPQSLGIQFTLPPKEFPQPGDYAISMNFLMGRPFLIRTPTETGEAPLPSPEPSNELTGVVSTYDDQYRYFRFFQPNARIGQSIFVFHLTAEDVARFRHALSRVQNR